MIKEAKHPLVSLLLIILIVSVGFMLIGPAIGLAAASFFYEGNLLVAIQGSPDSSLFTPLMIMQGCAAFTGLILLPAIYIKWGHHQQIGSLLTLQNPWPVVVPLLVLIGITFQVALSPVIEWNMTFQFPEFMQEFGAWARAQEDKLIELTRVLTHFQSSGDFVLGFIVIALIPGIGEELVFRGLIQNELYRGSKNIHVSIWVAAFLFSAIHMQFFGFVPRLLLGALFGYIYHWSGNLLVPMFAHFFHNGFTLVMMYLYQTGAISMDVESTEAAPWPYVATTAVITFALLYYFKKLYTENTSTSTP